MNIDLLEIKIGTKAEAERLAKLYPGEEIEVLKIVGLVKAGIQWTQ